MSYPYGRLAEMSSVAAQSQLTLKPFGQQCSQVAIFVIPQTRLNIVSPSGRPRITVTYKNVPITNSAIPSLTPHHLWVMDKALQIKASGLNPDNQECAGPKQAQAIIRWK